jgi:hypothetical protein
VWFRGKERVCTRERRIWRIKGEKGKGQAVEGLEYAMKEMRVHLLPGRGKA